ncbi:thiamine pyrophosphate-dependent dehydrogenase E1 component subunit alpha [Chloroflexota bacterium]
MPTKKAAMIKIYTVMVRIRTFEERIVKEFKSGQVPGFLHVYSGEEAVAAGTCAHLRPDDYITSTHRGHGHAIAKGCELDRMAAELYGKSTGYNGGKGGSMHLADPDLGILGANGIVGAGIPIAGGAALSAKLRKTDQVAVCFLGDGATNTSRFHEGVNLASVWNLPVVYVIENNMIAETTYISYAAKVSKLADRAVAYGIPGVTIDGNDAIAVYETAGQAIARARKGEGPTLVECQTCRMSGHYVGDPEPSRTKEQRDECIKKDPIPRFKKKLIEMGILTEEHTAKIYQEIEDEMNRAIKYAEESPYPDQEAVLADVYA